MHQQTLNEALARRDELQAKLTDLHQQRIKVYAQQRQVLSALSWLIVATRRRRRPDTTLAPALEWRRQALRWEAFALSGDIMLLEADVGMADLAVGDVLLRMLLLEHALLRGDLEAPIMGVILSREAMKEELDQLKGDMSDDVIRRERRRRENDDAEVEAALEAACGLESISRSRRR